MLQNVLLYNPFGPKLIPGAIGGRPGYKLRFLTQSLTTKRKQHKENANRFAQEWP